MHTKTQVASVVLKLAFPPAMGIAFFTAVYIRFYSGLIPVRDLPAWPAYAAYFVLSLTLWSVLEARFDLSRSGVDRSSLRSWAWSLAQADLLTLALVSSVAFFWRGYSFSRYTVAIFWVLHMLFCLAAVWAVRAWLKRRLGSAATWVFLIGDAASVEDVERECLPAGKVAVVERLPDVASAIGVLEGFQPPARCREILASVSAGEAAQLPALVETLARQPVPSSVMLAGLSFGAIHETPSFVVFSTGPQASEVFDYVFSKRLVDVLVSATGLAALAPLMLTIAAVTWLRSGGPVVFAQQRVCRGGRRFPLYKFRTLPAASLADGDVRWSAPPSDGWGEFLRRTGLDELPQLYNVLLGDMSLVGPRPERPHFVEQFRRQLPFYSTRHRLQAGITGWAQVNGWRGDTSIPRRVEHDLYYLRHWSLAFDFRILWMTLKDFVRRLFADSERARKGADARSVQRL